MREPLDNYYAVKDYDSQEEARKAGLNPPPWDSNKPIKTWILPESAANGATFYRYKAIVKSPDGARALVEEQVVGRRELPILNVPPGSALGGEDRVDASYSVPVPIKPLPPDAQPIIVFGTIMIERPDAIAPSTPVSYTKADQDRLARIENLLLQATGK